MTPEAIANASAQAMWQNDLASPGLGIVLEHVAPGTARVSMQVQPRMLNGHHICHGGFMFTLADTAFAFACNSKGVGAVAAHCSITFLRPVQEGVTLVATAQELHTEGRAGIYDVRVTAGGAVVAEFRGLSRTTSLRWVDEGAMHAP